MAQHTGPSGEGLGITTGVAQLDIEDGSAAELVAAADHALLQAKGSHVFDVPQPQG